MKRITTLFIILVSCLTIQAQDIITLNDGSDIQAKVTEVGISQISYKKYTQQDGPTYVISKDNILMITYENGEREMYNSNNSSNNKSALPQGIMTYNSWSNKVSIGGVTVENETLQLYLSPEDYSLFRRSKVTQTIGGIIGIIGAVPFGYCSGTWIVGGKPNQELFIGSSILFVGGLIVSLIGENNMKSVIQKYNSSLVFAPTINMGTSPNDLSMGLAIAFSF